MRRWLMFSLRPASGCRLVYYCPSSEFALFPYSTPPFTLAIVASVFGFQCNVTGYSLAGVLRLPSRVPISLALLFLSTCLFFLLHGSASASKGQAAGSLPDLALDGWVASWPPDLALSRAVCLWIKQPRLAPPEQTCQNIFDTSITSIARPVTRPTHTHTLPCPPSLELRAKVDWPSGRQEPELRALSVGYRTVSGSLGERLTVAPWLSEAHWSVPVALTLHRGRSHACTKLAPLPPRYAALGGLPTDSSS